MGEEKSRMDVVNQVIPTRPRQRGIVRITRELWHELLTLPDGVRVVDVDVEHNADGWRDRPSKAVVFLLEGEGLPDVREGERSPAITPVYEHAAHVENKRFLRFERIDDGQEEPRPERA